MSGERRRRADERSRALAAALGLDRLSIFVPAVMSVGLLFWVVSELNQLVRSRAEEGRERRASVAAETVADEVLGRPPSGDAGLRPRPVYLMIAVTLLGVAAYVGIGSVANYVRSGSYLEGSAWILAVALAAAVLALTYGTVALVAFVRWPVPPAWVRGALLRSPLGAAPRTDDELEGQPPWWLTTAIAATGALTAVTAALVAWSPEIVHRFNTSADDWLVAHDPLAEVTFLDPIGNLPVIVALLALAGLAAIRCRVLAAASVMAVVVSLVLSVGMRAIIHEPRPPGMLVGQLDSFPSTHVVLAVLFAGIFPLALAVVFDRTSIVWPVRAVLAVGVVASAFHQVAIGLAWPTDIIGGALLGLMFTFATQWAVDNQPSHRSCHHCPWSARPAGTTILGAIPIHPSAQQALRYGARLAAAAAATGLAVLTFTVSLPVDADGYGLGSSVNTVVQLSLAALITVGALLAWRWQGVAAVLVALAATGAGVYAAGEYTPAVAVVLAGVLLVPAVLLWLSWQHQRRPLEIAALAVFTGVLLGSTWAGAVAVNDYFYGPTHPESTVAEVPVDLVEWVWSGNLAPDRITVVARPVRGVASARLAVWTVPAGTPFDLTTAPEDPAPGAFITGPAVPDEDGLVRFTVDGLAPDTEHRYQVLADDEADEGRGFGRFHTPAVGPYSFTVTAGACARVGSNGAVFDAIRAEDPLLHVALGDLHYANVDATYPDPFVDAWGRAMSTPAQSALARDVPEAYVWDDHDYGPNDSGAEFPGRSAARDAYRRAVPHYEVPEGDAPIYQAFTIGRVRFVLTDSRSEATDDTLLGDEQLAWLLDELRTSSATHAAVVWVSSVPWIGEPDPTSDGWAGRPEERALIADAIAGADIDNLVMISGDAHMVALDDGTNSDYSSTGGGGFPVLAAAALDRPGNVKGGPYSAGTYPGSGQYGVVGIDDGGGDTVTVRLTGKTWDGRVLVDQPFTFEVPPAARVGVDAAA